MPDRTQIPYLLELLDDESEKVRYAVLKELLNFGDTLEDELIRLSISSQKKRQVRVLLHEQHRLWLQENWASWFEITEDKKKLELALSLLAEFQSDRKVPQRLTPLLNQLAQEYEETFVEKDALLLSHFLFEQKKIKGAENNYYHPDHSNLVYVIEQKRGLPISLACVYILVGNRLGLNIEGCNFPGHFLAKAITSEETFYVDCFNQGQILDEENFIALDEQSAEILKEILLVPADAQTIVRRVLSNLVHAYQHIGHQKNSLFFSRLLETT